MPSNVPSGLPARADPSGRKRARRRAASRRSASSETAETAYDAAARVQASRDAVGTVTGYFYNSDGRLWEVFVNCTNSGMTVPTSGWESCAATGTSDATWNLKTTYTYDAHGNRETETRPNGHVTKFVYDGADRVIERIENYVASPTQSDQSLATYTEYDEAGRGRPSGLRRRTGRPSL